jgi:hypothetical protein
MEPEQQDLTVDRLLARLAELEHETARLQREYVRLGGILRERLAADTAEAGPEATPGPSWSPEALAPSTEYPQASGGL